MRKENSNFNMHFMSQPGVKMLHNNDYYGCSELDNFACYVIADGLQSGNRKKADTSARLAVEAIITAFNDNPSISKSAMGKYLKAAHDALYNARNNKWGKASVMVVVTNYQSLRYGHAGNCRFNLYRGGKLHQESDDNSLTWELAKDGHIPKDKIAKHEERNNLDMYCGIIGTFSPSISKKIKLKNSDIFTIFTRGIWENAHTNDIMAAIQSGENEPSEAGYYLERLILDKATNDVFIDNYTICFIFADKIYVDPNEAKRRKRIIIISIVAVVLTIIIIVAIVIFNNWRNRVRNDMHIAYHNGIELIQGSNFTRAMEELQEAYRNAERLRDNRHRNDIGNHRMLVEAIIHADSLLTAQNYELALAAFGAALNRSRYADNLAITYIELQRERTAGYLNVHELIFLGDTFADIRDWENAELQYQASRSLASRLFYTEGRRLANEAIENLQQLRQQDFDEQREQAQIQITAAGFIIEGDNAFRDGDMIAARMFYQMARDQYVELGNEAIIETIDQKIELVEQAEERTEQNLELAEGFVFLGELLVEQREYTEARRFFILARDIFANYGEDSALYNVMFWLELAESRLIGDVPAFESDSNFEPSFEPSLNNEIYE